MDRTTGKIVDKSLIFHIKVRDVNDHAPQFPKEEFSIHVQENQAAGVCGGLLPTSTLVGVVVLVVGWRGQGDGS